MTERPELSEERRQRYSDKLGTLNERTGNIEEWTSVGVEQVSQNLKDKLAVLKAFQEAVEAAADVCAMYLSDAGMAVGDDSENISKAAGKLFSKELEQDLIEANGLRNRAVHEYDGFDDEVGIKSAIDLNQSLKSFRQEVKEWMQEN